MQKTYEDYLQKVIEVFSSGDFSKEVQKAKEEYFFKTGGVHEEDRFYESKMSAFIDWYIFDRELEEKDIPPIRLFYRKHKSQLSEEEKKIYSAFTKNIHSLFTVKQISPTQILLKDLFNSQTYWVEALPLGFQRGDVFEGRLIPFENKMIFSKGFCFHPKEARKFLLREIRKFRYLEKPLQEKLILNFARMCLLHERYTHIKVEDIYTWKKNKL